jgi:hypothetical protein
MRQKEEIIVGGEGSRMPFFIGRNSHFPSAEKGIFSGNPMFEEIQKGGGAEVAHST